MGATMRAGMSRVFYFDRRIGVLRKSFTGRIVFCLLAGLGSGYDGWAQDSNRGERYFKEMDRDNNGAITEEEYNYVDGRTRDRLKAVGLAYRPGLTLEMFSRVGQKLEELRDKEREKERSERENRSEGNRASTDGGSSSRSKPREKVKINVTLPVNYVPLDKDRDGQIGLYEWDRPKLAEFRGLDRNHDGFLSPRELVTPASPAVVGSGPLSTGPATTGTTPSASTPPAVATPGQPAVAVAQPAATPAVVPTPPEEDRETKQAKVFFKITDKNSDGTISSEEWSESRGVRVKFEQAKASPTLPLSEDEFIKQYRALEQKKSSST
jgi:Ca2+-binding EF-hand superfamily protein